MRFRNHNQISIDRFRKLEFQLGADRDAIDKLLSDLNHLQKQQDIALKRINYLESTLIRTNSLLSSIVSRNIVYLKKE